MSFRKAILAFIASVAVLAASSCVDRGGEDLVVNITTSIGEEGIEFDMNAQDTVFTLTSNCDWTVEMEVENPWENEAEEFEQNPWLTVSPVSGEASEQPVTITVAADANTSDAAEITYDRAVIVYFRTDREQFASVRVFQEGQERKPNAADTISISELRQMAPVAQDSVVTITDPYIIKGVVVSSRDPQTVSNNNIYIQDGTEPHSGLLVYSSAFSSCNFGDEVEITITDGTLEYYFGQLEFKPASTDDVVVVGKQENPEAAEIEGASLVNGDYEGQYVKMYAQVVQGDLEKTMGDSPSIETEDGFSFLMYSRSNTPWAGEEVPQGAGTVYGLVGSYNGVYQLVPSRATDFEGMTESRFTGRPAVTTGEGQLSEDKSSMTVTGEYTYAGEAADVTEVGVAYKLVDAEEYTKVKAEKVESPFTVTIPLETGAYKYYAYVMIGEREYQGETLTVTNEETVLNVADVVAAILDGTVEDNASLASLGAYLQGIVAAGNQSANYNGKYSLVDGTGEEATGIVLYGMYDVELNPGDRVRINLANAAFDNYNNLREIKFNEGTDINAQVEVLESGVAFDVPELTVAELLSGDWQGQYVTVKNVRSAMDTLTAWTESGNSTNRNFTDGTDEFIVRTQSSADWAAENINPDVTADLSGVVEVFYDDIQMYAATYDDIKAFSVPAGDEPEEPVEPGEPVAVTIAEFLEAPVSADTWYQLTGTITRIEKEDYGNIYIEDETAEVYIYGLTATK
ncbi:lipoprotein putative [Alistipes sp. CAG:831]|mgnify:CR=1 FL=1|nr:lipoprotein putative [Alistipes sp. CAG:831]